MLEASLITIRSASHLAFLQIGRAWRCGYRVLLEEKEVCSQSSGGAAVVEALMSEAHVEIYLVGLWYSLRRTGDGAVTGACACPRLKRGCWAEAELPRLKRQSYRACADIIAPI